MGELIFSPPSKDQPGYLRRFRQVVSFQEAIKSGNFGLKNLDDLIDFLLDFVEEPADREEAKDQLLNASETQFLGMLNAIGGGDSADPLE